MKLCLRSSDGKTGITVLPRAYGAKRRADRKGGTLYRLFNTVRCDVEYEGPDMKRHASSRCISTFDIERMCTAAESVLSGRLGKASVASRRRDIKLTFVKTSGEYRLSLEIAADPGRTGVCLTNLDAAAFSRYCAVFRTWKAQYPVLSERELSRVYTLRPGTGPERSAAKAQPHTGSRDISGFKEPAAAAYSETWLDIWLENLDDPTGDDEKLD